MKKASLDYEEELEVWEAYSIIIPTCLFSPVLPTGRPIMITL